MKMYADLNGTINVEAVFQVTGGPVRIGTTYYSDLLSAYNAVPLNQVTDIEIDTSVAQAGITFNKDNVSARLIGGFAPAFSGGEPVLNSASIITGTVTIARGTISIGSKNNKGAIIIR
jgi:hypothetical protein